MYLPQGTEHLKSDETAIREAVKLAADASYDSEWRKYSTAYICGYGGRAYCPAGLEHRYTS